MLVRYSESGDLGQVDHVHLQLDSAGEVRDLDNDGQYLFTDLAPGTHTLRAYLADVNHNILGAPASVTFSVRALFGDVNNDCLIDIFDLSGVTQAFGSRDGELRYGAVYDLNNDRMISIFDVAIVARKFGMRC